MLIITREKKKKKSAANPPRIHNNRVLLMCGSAVIDVQCEQEGAEHTALGSDAVLTERQPELSGGCMQGSLLSFCRWSYTIIYLK